MRTPECLEFSQIVESDRWLDGDLRNTVRAYLSEAAESVTDGLMDAAPWRRMKISVSVEITDCDLI